MKNSKHSSPAMAALASAILHDKEASESAKSLAGSVLAQASTDKESSKTMESLAARVLQDATCSAEVKSLAASVLAQSRK